MKLLLWLHVSSQTIFRSPSLLDQLYGELHGRTNTAPNLQVQAEDPNQMATQKVLAMRSKLTLPDKDDTSDIAIDQNMFGES